MKEKTEYISVTGAHFVRFYRLSSERKIGMITVSIILLFSVRKVENERDRLMQNDSLLYSNEQCVHIHIEPIWTVTSVEEREW